MICKNCGAELKDDAVFCNACGASMDTTDTEVVNEEPTEETLEQNTDQPTEKSNDEPIEESTDEPIEESTEEPIEESNEEPGTIEEPTEESIEVAEETIEMPLEPDNEDLHKEPEEKPRNLKLPFLILASAAVFIVLIFTMFMGGGSDTGYQKSADEIICLGAEDKTFVVINGESVVIEEPYSYSRTSIDNKKAYILTNKDNVQNLRFFNGKENTMVDSNVYSIMVADSGNAALYTKMENDILELYYFDSASKKSEKIVSNVFESLSISPDGKTFGYCVYNDNSFNGYVMVYGSEPIDLGVNNSPVIVSDGGKYVYYTKMDTATYAYSLYIKTADQEVQLSDELGFGTVCYLNKDYSQLIFSSNDASYFVKDASEKVKIADKNFYDVIAPMYSQGKYEYTGGVYIQSFCQTDLKDIVFINDNGIFNYTGEGEAINIAETNSYYARITSDGKTLFYLDSSANLKKKVIASEGDAEQIATNVMLFDISLNGDTVYFVTNDNKLNMLKNGEEKPISEDVINLVTKEDGKEVYFISGGKLYSSSNGGEKELITEENTMIIYAGVNGVYYMTGKDETSLIDVYFSSDGKNFNKICEGVIFSY